MEGMLALNQALEMEGCAIVFLNSLFTFKKVSLFN